MTRYSTSWMWSTVFIFTEKKLEQCCMFYRQEKILCWKLCFWFGRGGYRGWGLLTENKHSWAQYGDCVLSDIVIFRKWNVALTDVSWTMVGLAAQMVTLAVQPHRGEGYSVLVRSLKWNENLQRSNNKASNIWWSKCFALFAHTALFVWWLHFPLQLSIIMRVHISITTGQAWSNQMKRKYCSISFSPCMLHLYRAGV